MSSPADLAALHRACFTTPRPWSEAEFAEILGTPTSFLVIARGGYLIGRTVVDEAELLTLAVDPRHRRQGVGGTLVARFLNLCSQRGAARAFLEVAAGNAPARALYGQTGFVESGLRRAYYRRPDGSHEDAIVMTCPIARPDPA